MIIRKIRPEEMKTALEVWSHVFQIPLKDAALSSTDFFEQRTMSPGSREDLFWDRRWAVFDDREEVMMASMIAAPYTMQFDGQEVPMAGIGGVAVLPPYRKNGCTRVCLTKVLQAAYEDGMLFSYLYPFSAAFYRKFGYGHAGERNRWRIRINAIPDFSVPGSYRLLDKALEAPSTGNGRLPDGTDGASSTRNGRVVNDAGFRPGCLADLQQADEVWFRKYNLMTRDEDIEYRAMKSLHPYENTTYTYIYYDAEQHPAAAVTYSKKKENECSVLQCSRFVFVNAEGLCALLALIRKEQAQYDLAEIVLPGEFDLSVIIPEWKKGAVSCVREQYGMVRVVNAEEVLRLAKARGSGTLRIRIKDDIIDENNACFAVSFENGTVTEVTKTRTVAAEKTTAAAKHAAAAAKDTGGTTKLAAEATKPSVALTDEPEDIVLSINAFSTLIAGRCDPEMLPYLPEVRLHCTVERAGQLFYRKPVYTSKMF